MTLAPAELDARVRYVQLLADAGALPVAFRKRPADLLLVLAYADALGIPAATAIGSLYVVDGRVTLSAQLVASLVRARGHRLRTTTEYDAAGRPVVTASVTRSDDPEWSAVATWTLDRAARAGLADRDTWRKYPEQMLRARATVEAAREACPEALAGLYLSDEVSGSVPPGAGPVVVGELVDDDPAADVIAADDQLGGVLSAPARAVAESARAGAPRTAMDRTRDALGVPRRSDDRPATEPQLRAMWARIHECRPRDEVHARWAVGLLVHGVPVYVEHVGQLTRSQLSTLLDYDRGAVLAALEATADPHEYPHPGDGPDDDPDAVDVAELDDSLSADVDAEQRDQLDDGPPQRPQLSSDDRTTT